MPSSASCFISISSVQWKNHLPILVLHISTLGCKLKGFLARLRKIDRATKPCNHSCSREKEDSCRKGLSKPHSGWLLMPQQHKRRGRLHVFHALASSTASALCHAVELQRWESKPAEA